MRNAVSPGRRFRRAALVFALAATLVPLCERLGSADEPSSKPSKKTTADSKSKKAAVEPPQKLSLVPSKFEFSNPRGTLQLVATGTYSQNRVRDLTADVKLTSSDPNVARVKGSVVV